MRIIQVPGADIRLSESNYMVWHLFAGLPFVCPVVHVQALRNQASPPPLVNAPSPPTTASPLNVAGCAKMC